MDDLKKKDEKFWRKKLTSDQFHIMREKGTELPFSGKYDAHFQSGIYRCAACGQELFSSDTKYDAHCGWPSFSQAIDEKRVEFHEDTSFGMHRTEVTCARCGAHLGHVFSDGPAPTGTRYCINSASLDFES